MHELTFISRSTAPLTEDGFAELSETLREKFHDSLSGLCVAWNGFFLHLLEGPKTPVFLGLSKVERLSHHANPRLIHDGSVAERRFEGFSFHQVSPSKPWYEDIVSRHPPLTMDSSHYRDPMLAFALLFDLRFFTAVLHRGVTSLRVQKAEDPIRSY